MICQSCKRNLPHDQFGLNRSGRHYRSCDICRLNTKRDLVHENSRLREEKAELVELRTQNVWMGDQIDQLRAALTAANNTKDKINGACEKMLVKSFRMRARIQELEAAVECQEDADEGCDNCPGCLQSKIEDLEAQLADSVPKKTHQNKLKKVKSKLNGRIASLQPPGYEDVAPPPYS